MKIKWLIVFLVLLCGIAQGQEKIIPQPVSVDAVKKASIGDVLLRQKNTEIRKADAGKVTAKVYSSDQWDMTGEPLVKYDSVTGKMWAKSRYVKFIPDEVTRKLEVKRDVGNAGVKEFYTIPDAKVTKLSWTIETDASKVEYADGTLTFRAFNDLLMFQTPPPVAWDADKKPVELKVTYLDNRLTYDIIKDKYSYPITVDPTILRTNDTTGRLNPNGNVNFNTQRNQTDAVTASIITSIIEGATFSTAYTTYRGLLRYLTSSVIGNIDSAKVTLVVSSLDAALSFNTRLCATSDTLNANYFNNSMFNEFKGWAASGAYSPTYLSDTIIASSVVTVGDSVRFKLNSAGLTAINIIGTTQYFLLSADDISDTPPTGNQYLVFEQASTYLQIWYSIPSATNSRSTLSKDGVITPYSKNGVITPMR